MIRPTVFFGSGLLLIALLVAALPVAAETSAPEGSGIVLTIDVGTAYRPGDLVEIHFFVFDNGTLAEPTWPDPWPHVHGPNLPEAGLQVLDKPVIWGHVGAYRVNFTAPEDPGLYAIHGAAVVDGVFVFAAGSFTVVEPDDAVLAAASQAMIWSLASLGVSVVVLILVVVLLVRRPTKA